MPSFWLGMVIILVAACRGSAWIPPLTYVEPAREPVAARHPVPAAVAGGRLPLLRAHHAHHALGDARGAARGLHPHGVGQGPERARRWCGGTRSRTRSLPVVTVIGIEFAFLIGGLVVTETVFNLPGVARFLVQAILWRDYPVVQNLVMFIAIVVDPRPTSSWTCSTASSTRGCAMRARPAEARVAATPTGVELPAPAASAAAVVATTLVPLRAQEAAGGGRRRPHAGHGADGDLRRRAATHDPIATDAATRWRAPSDGALARHRPPRPRHLLAHRARRPRLADRRPRLHAARLGARRHHRPAVRATPAARPTSSPSACWTSCRGCRCSCSRW